MRAATRPALCFGDLGLIAVRVLRARPALCFGDLGLIAVRVLRASPALGFWVLGTAQDALDAWRCGASRAVASS